ncbi:MAG: anti sigma factor C-terminal domain-containing protein, partial [Bacillaceae bacterium]
LQFAIKYKSANKEDLQAINDMISKNDQLVPTNVKIIGAVVTGKGENLKKLEQLSFIKEASIGAKISQ